MSDKNTELLNLIKFYVNEKANDASKHMELNRNHNNKEFQFYYGQYMAFNEIFSMLSNIKP